MLSGCGPAEERIVEFPILQGDAVWDDATIYFLLTDRFHNGDPGNDIRFNRNVDHGYLRGFEGGDLKGVTEKIRSGYFTDLGVTAIWMTPITEQIQGATDEGQGMTYAYHGYWTSDWTSIDPNLGTAEDLHELIAEAHSRGIRIILDAIVNHTGPVTDIDPVWPEAWVRTEPQCTYQDYETTVTCTLVKNLPDIRTESDQEVELPLQLVEKWKREGRYEQEVAELDAFFERTGHPRAPRFYIMKWLTDYITEFGIDGYRVDTVKHTEEYVWSEFRELCDASFAAWKATHPDKVLDDTGFYIVGEVYNYNINNGRSFDFGDREVDYFSHGFNSLINFGFMHDAQDHYEDLFSKYEGLLKNELTGKSVLNYASSHDDGGPFDRNRERPFETANKLLLVPGGAQIYYGDERGHPLQADGAEGDVNLRIPLDWETVQPESQEILDHWRKLGQFRKDHPAIAMGNHTMLTEVPYSFARTGLLNGTTDAVVIGLELDSGEKILDVEGVYENGTKLRDAYSGVKIVVKEGKAVFESPFSVVLLEEDPDS
jgi:alpha-amylase